MIIIRKKENVCNFMRQIIIMTTTLLKHHIAKAVNDINDKGFLQAFNTIVSNKAEETDFELTTVMKSELETRKERYKNNTSKSYTWQNVKAAALKVK